MTDLTWTSETDWQNAQSSNNIAINGGSFGLATAAIDDFEAALYEDQNKTLSDYWTGTLTEWSRQQSTVQEGQYAIEDTTGSTGNMITRDSPNLSRPFTVSWYVNISGGSNADGSFVFATSQPSDRSTLDGYTVYHWADNNATIIRRYDNGSISSVDNQYNTGVQAGTWYKYTADFGTSDITFSLDGSQFATITDSTYDSLHVGFIDFSGAARYDNIQEV